MNEDWEYKPGALCGQNAAVKKTNVVWKKVIFDVDGVFKDYNWGAHKHGIIAGLQNACKKLMRGAYHLQKLENTPFYYSPLPPPRSSYNVVVMMVKVL